MNSLVCRICLETEAKLCIFDNSENSIHSKILFCLNEKLEDVVGFPRKICIKCNDLLDTFVNFINNFRESSQTLLKQFDVAKIDSIEYEDLENEAEVKKEIIERDTTISENFLPFALNLNEIVIKKIVKTNDSNFIWRNNGSLTIHKTENKSNKLPSEQLDTIKIEDSNDYDDFRDTEVEIDIKQELINADSTSITEAFEFEPVSLTFKEEPDYVVPNKKRGNLETNRIASSILEGNFVWKDNKWCINTEKRKKSKRVVKLKKLKQTNKRKERNNEKQVKVKIKKDPSKLCDLCGEVCPSSDKLAHHKRLKHFRNPIKCPECPKVLASDYYLQCHLKRKHDANSKKFNCTQCTMSFAFQGEVRTHIKRVHNKKDLPKQMFSCKICGKVYKCPRSVVVHERSVHTGHRPAECSVCGARFYHEDYLKEHMRLHTGETPYKCPICGRGYAQRGNMKSHLRNHRKSDLDPITLSKIRPNYLKFMKP